MITWHDLETAAPEVAAVGAQRLELTRVALLGTVRRSGSPRISPVEHYLSHGHLLFGAMAWSLKSRDLLRDPRCVLHSAITGPNNAEPEFKLYGCAFPAASEMRDACANGWWHAQPVDAAIVFELSIEQATLITWRLAEGRMVVQRWSPERGLTETSRQYP